MAHIPVLLHQVVESLDLKPGEVFVDATLGYAGHSSQLGKLLGKDGLLIGIDADGLALNEARDILKNLPCRVLTIKGNFKDISSLLKSNNIHEVDAVLFDLGVNSNQLDHDDRGFSFRTNTPLKMTLNNNSAEELITAEDIVNDWSEEVIADIIYAYGEERYSRRIAKAIVENRVNNRIKTTQDLVEIIKQAVPISYLKSKIHPATRTFQALRIAVNNELENLETALNEAWNILSPNGRLAVISFHSLEARIVKNFFKNKKDSITGEMITKKVVKPDLDEIKHNPRSRSAQLRVIRKK